MHNWFAIETEAEFRRQEWERAVIADERVAQLKSGGATLRWRRLPELPHLSLVGFRQKVSARLAFALPATKHGDCAASTN